MNATTVKMLIGAIALAAAGCATETTMYRNVSEPPSATSQAPVAPYPIPAKDPKGTVYVISFGGEPMATPSGTQGFYLHLRIAAENRADDAAWTIDTRDQVVSLGATPLRPTYAQGSAGGSLVTVAAGQHGYLDVFYPLPPQGSPGQAILSWQVHRGNEPVTGTTPFELVPNEPTGYVDYRPVGVTVEMWPAWWWGVGFYPWLWGPGWGWGYHPYWGGGYVHGVGPRGAPAPARGFGGGMRVGRGFHR
ncbi:MAG: hypothetical protein WCG85_25205 [Polyangia bacterium]